MCPTRPRQHNRSAPFRTRTTEKLSAPAAHLLSNPFGFARAIPYNRARIPNGIRINLESAS